MSGSISHEQRERVLILTIDRPEKKNALTLAMYSQLAEALLEAQEDGSIRVVLLTGSGDAFTSGNDIGDFVQNPPTGEDSPTFRLLAALVRADKPLVAAVDGAAIGIGTTMLLHCDLVYASESAVFQLPFASLGLVPEAGSSLLLPAMLGHQRAAELLLLGERFDARKAASLGFVNELVQGGDVLERALERSRQLAAQPPGAIRLTKRLLRAGLQDALVDAMRHEGEHFVDRLRSAEAIEAFSAFLQKRTPDFSKFD